MDAVWLHLRADLRGTWRTWLLLAVLLGLVGGTVLTAAAGARRTDTAYPRLLATDHHGDVLISPNGTGRTGYYTALARLPSVASLVVVQEFNVAIPRAGAPDVQVQAEASPPGGYGASMDAVKVLDGELADPRDPHAAMIDPELAAREHLHPGSTLHLWGLPVDAQGNPDLRHPLHLAFRVSAIVLFDDQVVPTNRFNEQPLALLTPAFLATRTAAAIPGADGAGIRLRPGYTVATFTRQAEALARRYPATGGQLFVADLADQEAEIERAIRPEAVALALFALLAGLVGLAIAVQLLSREVVLGSGDYPTLRALGMRRRDLMWLSVVRVALITLTAAFIAVGVAVAASPLMPIGPARLAEPSPGVEVNVALLGVGLVVAALLPVLLVTPAAWRATADSPGPSATETTVPRRSRIASRLRAAGAPVSAPIGVQMAFEPGQGRTAVPVQSTLIGAVIAVTAVAAALVFGANLNHLVTTPGQYGQNWQRELDLGFGAAPGAVLDSAVAHQPGIAAYAYGDYGEVTVAGRAVPAIAIDTRRGRGFATILAGRAPTGPDEIAFGARTLRGLGLHLGDTVRVVVPGANRRVRIVGEAVFPSFSMGSFTPTDLGSGALVSPSLLAAQADAVCSGSPPCYSFVLTRFGSGTSLPAASARLDRATVLAGCPVGYCNVFADQRPTDIEDYTRVRFTPLLLSAVLALFGLAMVTYVLVTSVQRRRRDLAVLKTLGFTRSQVVAVTAWQASALAVVALLVGLPLGVVVGRGAWALFADALGVSAAAIIPWSAVLLAVPVTLVLVNAATAWPGWAASRVKPAAVLRTE